MRKQYLIIILSAFGFANTQNRPQDNWIFRGVMKDKGRIIFLALDANLSLAYESSSCGLYMAWNGGMEDSYNTYDHQAGGNHGATIDPMGSILYWQSTEPSVSATPVPDGRGKRHGTFDLPGVPVWSITEGTLETKFRGYTVTNGGNIATLNYQLTAGTSKITVTETPEYAAGGGGTQLIRVFSVSGTPAGRKLTLKLRGSDVSGVNESWSATGAGSVVDGILTLSGDGQTTVTGTW